MKLLDFAIRNTTEYVKKMPKDLRKNTGNFSQVKKLQFLWLNCLIFPLTKLR